MNKKSKIIIKGLCGSGKSHSEQLKIQKSLRFKPSKFLWVVQSTKQAIDAQNRFTGLGIDSQIVVSFETWEKYQEWRDRLDVNFSQSHQVYIITMKAFLLGSYFNDIERLNLNIQECIIDEIEIIDFVRPSLLTKNIVSLWSKQNNDIIELYSNQFSKRDLTKALDLKIQDVNLNFITEEFNNPRFNLKILTTEELPCLILRKIGFIEKNYSRDINLEKEFKTSYFINFKHSDFINLKWLRTKEFNNIIKNYDNIIGNSLDKNYNTFNLKSSKGLDINQGENLIIIRHLLPEHIDLITELIKGLNFFNKTEIEIKSCFYKDLLLQACGRSLGYRGKTQVDVIIHSKILKLIDLNSLPYNNKIKKLYHVDETFDELNYLRDMENRNRNNKRNRNKNYIVEELIKNNFILTENNNDFIDSEIVKSKLKGTGVTLVKIAEFFKVKIKRNKFKIHITGVKLI